MILVREEGLIPPRPWRVELDWDKAQGGLMRGSFLVWARPMATEYLVLRKGPYLTDGSRAWNKFIGQLGGSQGLPGSILIAAWLRVWFWPKDGEKQTSRALNRRTHPLGVLLRGKNPSRSRAKLECASSSSRQVAGNSEYGKTRWDIPWVFHQQNSDLGSFTGQRAQKLQHINDKKKKGMDGGLVDEKRLKRCQVFVFFKWA